MNTGWGWGQAGQKSGGLVEQVGVGHVSPAGGVVAPMVAIWPLLVGGCNPCGGLVTPVGGCSPCGGAVTHLGGLWPLWGSVTHVGGLWPLCGSCGPCRGQQNI